MSTLLQITAGRGPAEVHAFVEDLADALSAWVHEHSGAAERVAANAGSVRLRIDHVDMRPWRGTHELVQAVRGRGQRKRWFCAVFLHVAPEDQPWSGEGVVIRASRAGGPGGQGVNTTDAAVRAVHAASGLAVRVTSQRSQQQNRTEALRALERRWLERQSEQLAVHERRVRESHDRVVRGEPIARWHRDRRGNLNLVEGD